MQLHESAHPTLPLPVILTHNRGTVGTGVTGKGRGRISACTDTPAPSPIPAFAATCHPAAPASCAGQHALSLSRVSCGISAARRAGPCPVCFPWSPVCKEKQKNEERSGETTENPAVCKEELITHRPSELGGLPAPLL